MLSPGFRFKRELVEHFLNTGYFFGASNKDETMEAHISRTGQTDLSSIRNVWSLWGFSQ